MSAKKPRLCRRPFLADPVIPPDHRGRGVCVHCSRVGEPGDPRHPQTTDGGSRPGRSPNYEDRSSAVLGERDES